MAAGAWAVEIMIFCGIVDDCRAWRGTSATAQCLHSVNFDPRAWIARGREQNTGIPRLRLRMTRVETYVTHFSLAASQYGVTGPDALAVG